MEVASTLFNEINQVKDFDPFTESHLASLSQENIPEYFIPKVPLHFVPSIPAHSDFPSISPRDKLSYVEDKKTWKEMEQFSSSASDVKLQHFVSMLQHNVLVQKPADVLDFILDNFLSPQNRPILRQELDDISSVATTTN